MHVKLNPRNVSREFKRLEPPVFLGLPVDSAAAFELELEEDGGLYQPSSTPPVSLRGMYQLSPPVPRSLPRLGLSCKGCTTFSSRSFSDVAFSRQSPRAKKPHRITATIVTKGPQISV